MRKTACAVVWEGWQAKSRQLDPIKASGIYKLKAVMAKNAFGSSKMDNSAFEQASKNYFFIWGEVFSEYDFCVYGSFVITAAGIYIQIAEISFLERVIE